MKLHRIDVSTAFFHGELTKEVYMQQPDEFVNREKENFVCHPHNAVTSSPHAAGTL